VRPPRSRTRDDRGGSRRASTDPLDARRNGRYTGRVSAEAACVFCRIAAGALPAERVLEDDLVLAFRDARPQAPVHVLVVPKAHVASLWELSDERLAGRLLASAAEVARKLGLEHGWRLIANTREHGGQEVHHLHLHIVGGRKLGRMLPAAER
jgi:histidine triad (HIT) family protein